MSGSEVEIDLSESREESPTLETSEDDDEEEDFASAYAGAAAYRYEPIALPGEEIDEVNEDRDGLIPEVLEARYEGRIPVNQWCTCGHCHVEHLMGSLEYRCCKELRPAVGFMVFDGSIETIQCITQHEDFGPMTNTAVLQHVGPLLKDRSGRSYRCHAGQSKNEFLRAVGYRWLVRWLCGYLGWSNTRPLSACIYNNIRTKFQTHQLQGYSSNR
ncbi:hypothetical protein QZH41_012941 [Actinostola sp. cb2023]|nr:hypothetical protein QZH41_012941 [Actinostola sp. cb2023]